jgi:hypothetical protein
MKIIDNNGIEYNFNIEINNEVSELYLTTSKNKLKCLVCDTDFSLTHPDLWNIISDAYGFSLEVKQFAEQIMQNNQ